MATALKEPYREAAEAFREVAGTYLEAAFSSDNDHEPIPAGYVGPAPQLVIAREVTMEMSGTILDFFYTILRPRGPVPPGGIQQVLDELPDPGAGVAAAGPGVVAAADAARENPLDLNVPETAFVVMRLSDSLQWQFDPKRSAVTTKLAANSANYGGLRYVGPNGQVTDVPMEGCRLVYFIANPPIAPFFHGFNLEVELKQSDGSEGQPRSMPITIDPDIRNPGGSDG